MIKKLHLYVLVALLLLTGSVVQAQQKVLIEDFENGIPNTWSQTSNSSGASWVADSIGLQGQLLYNGAYASISASVSQPATRLMSPWILIQNLATPQLSFEYLQPSTTLNRVDTFSVFYRVSTDSSWNLLVQLVQPVNVWTLESLPLTNLADSVIQFAFEYRYNNGAGIGLDHVVVGNSAICTPPTHVLANGLTRTSALLHWTGLTQSQSYQLKVSTLSMTDLTQTADIFDGVVLADSFQLSGLLPGTTYYCYVKADCGDDDVSTWSSVCHFTTDCDAQSVPLIENFSSYGTGSGVMPTCWKGFTTNLYTSTQYPCITTFNGGSLYFNSKTYSYTYAVLPEFAVDSVNRLQVTFKGRKTQAAYNIKVGVMSNPYDVSTFEAIETFSPTTVNSWSEKNVSLRQYNGAGRYIAFLSDRRNEGADNVFYIDDLHVDSLPTCYNVEHISVTELSDTSAQFTWLPAECASSYLIVVVPVGVDKDSVPADTVLTTSYYLQGLSATTSYSLYIRSICSDGKVSDWPLPYSFTTTAHIFIPPVVSTFENQNEGWTLINGTQTNKFYIGGAIYHTGAGGLYVSNGLTSATYTTSSSTSTVYAKQGLYFTTGRYQISYDWKCQGESGYDYGRVYLAPGNATVYAGTNVMSTDVTSCPSGWMLLDNGPLKGSSSWSTNSFDVIIDSAAIYNVIIGWRNDYSGGSAPAISIDNFSIIPVACYTPIITVDSILQTHAFMSWDSDADSAKVKISTSAINSGLVSQTSGDVFNGIVQGHDLRINNLTPQTTYHCYVMGLCSSGDSTSWASIEFTTDCYGYVVNDSLSFTESFDSYQSIDEMSCWIVGTNSASSYPYISSAISNSAEKSMYFYSSSTSYCYASTQLILGDSIKHLMLSFNGYQSSASNYIIVGVMTNPHDITTFEKVDSICLPKLSTFRRVVVCFDNYTGNGQYIAFKVGPKKASSFYVDDVVIERKPTCIEPQHLSISNITTTSAQINLSTDNVPNSFEIKVYHLNNNIDLSSRADVLDTIITGNYYVLNGLNAASDYWVYVRRICATGDTSTWSDYFDFTTGCGVIGVPYYQTFDNNVFATPCWTKYTGLLGSTLTSGSSSWTTSTLNVLSGKHVKLNIYGKNCKSWLAMPTVSVQTPTLLSFDLALTDYANVDPIESLTNQSDDRFIVIMSTDNGVTWDQSNMTVWCDSTNANYPFSTIPTRGRRYSVNLAPYIGQSVMIAFYGESTASGGDNDLHLDNISLTPANSLAINDSICQDYAYQSRGFNIAASKLETTGMHVFSRIVYGADGNDTVLLLNLFVKPNLTVNLFDTICNDDVYTNYGYNLTQSGVYTRIVEASTGCDSTITLHLKVLDRAINATSYSLCQSELPYQWRGKTLTSSGVYADTIAARSGCDSIIQLQFMVLPEYNVAEQRNIMDSELPYQYLDTTFNTNTPLGTNVYILHRKTKAGCDSIVTLTLTVLTTGVTDISNDFCTLYPNPASPNQDIVIQINASQQELSGLLLEVFNSVGECVLRQKPTILPIHLSGLNTTGIYLVRLTTESGRVVWKKLVVK